MEFFIRICKTAINHTHPFYNMYVSEADIPENYHPLKDYILQIKWILYHLIVAIPHRITFNSEM